ncbi:cardiolipin synthase [Flavobacterium sp. NKUCC04_CG]|uniref:cardiolipin synthase n=1 Tax=Flavobacterium sp. NKUCC04_CG TaxID=2842121 RepID=UPI001C5A891B|nr:cardiolipin synthase [Flavobacterium sp. NKUCC04_CG]MBW3520028.1 cardiolipin synthase [Flavobacterium sp. NKUCC04_CG]
MIPTIDWFLLLEATYGLIVLAVVLRVIYDSNSTSKTLAYLLLVILVPVVGILFYFSFGINYRKRKMYSKKLATDEIFLKNFENRMEKIKKSFTEKQFPLVESNRSMIRLLSNKNMENSPLLINNQAEILLNGEAFFPKLIADLKQAKHHIHLEYYIYENDEIGNQIKNILIDKVKAGVAVRFIYDDFGCRSIRKNIVVELREAGVEIFAFNKITWIALANRMNYRNHRKIVIIDGQISYTGGINISDRYVNAKKTTPALYWRDTHLRIFGDATYALQHIFLSDWNFCSKQSLTVNEDFFPLIDCDDCAKLPMQIVASGPDSQVPSILYSVVKAINDAKSEILFTTPYYIPDESLQQAMIMAAMSGKKVKILLPQVSDSKMVQWASQSYFEELLEAGVELYFYQKGFIHAKSFVTDSGVSSIGTCNLDHRSFDLNFEVNAIVYDTDFADQMREIFYADCEHAVRLNHKRWYKRTHWKRLQNSFLRLFSPLL